MTQQQKEYVLVSTGTLHAAELRPDLENLQHAYDHRGGSAGVLAALRESASDVSDGDIGEAFVSAVLKSTASELRAKGHRVRVERDEDIVSNTVGWTRTPWSVYLLSTDEFARWGSDDYELTSDDEAVIDTDAGDAAVAALFAPR